MNDHHLYVLLRKPACRKQTENLAASDLFCAVRIPLAELDKTEPVEIARFLLADSYTPAWARLQRRPMRAGDGFWMNGVTHLFTSIRDDRRFTLFSTNSINIRKVLSG